MRLKVYIAAPWVKKADANLAQTMFENAGHTVTSRWIRKHRPFDNEPYDVQMRDNADALEQEALEDLEDVRESHILVILNLEKSEGKAFEFGYAYALEKTVIMVGEYSRNIFYRLPDVKQVNTVEEAVAMVSEMQEREDQFWDQIRAEVRLNVV